MLSASGAREVQQDAARVVVALPGQTALRGVLSVAPPTDPGAEPPDLGVLGAVGRQAGLALDRARLYEHTAGVARELQHSLLAVDPPVDPRYRVGAIYRPGVEMLEVGGDWYDVFLVEPGVLAFVVGDVVGRGLGAASAMGQLRSAVRAVAAPGVGPSRLLARLDRFVEQVEAAALSTLAYAELDLATGVVRYACAGHPPPVLLPTTGAGQLVWGGRSTPVGTYGQGEREEAELRLGDGDRLLLYTDGLVERRDRALDDGLAALAATVAATGGQPLARAVAIDRGRDAPRRAGARRRVPAAAGVGGRHVCSRPDSVRVTSWFRAGGPGKGPGRAGTEDAGRTTTPASLTVDVDRRARGPRAADAGRTRLRCRARPAADGCRTSSPVLRGSCSTCTAVTFFDSAGVGSSTGWPASAGGWGCASRSSRPPGRRRPGCWTSSGSARRMVVPDLTAGLDAVRDPA